MKLGKLSTPQQKDGEHIKALSHAGTQIAFHKRTISNNDFHTPTHKENILARKREERSAPKVMETPTSLTMLSPIIQNIKKQTPLEFMRRSDVMDSNVTESTLITRKIFSLGNSLKDVEQTMKISQIKQLIEQETAQCKEILGERQFHSAISYFRSKFNVKFLVIQFLQ